MTPLDIQCYLFNTAAECRTYGLWAVARSLWHCSYKNMDSLWQRFSVTIWNVADRAVGFDIVSFITGEGAMVLVCLALGTQIFININTYNNKRLHRKVI